MEARRHLRDLPPQLPGLQRRRHRRPQRHHPAPGLPPTLGVDAIWLAPMYPSPQVDFGYDISNYTAVDPQYGTLADFDRLLAAARAHHIRIMLDMVLNHTSDQHPWFLESASSRTNPTPTGTSGTTASPPPTPKPPTLTMDQKDGLPAQQLAVSVHGSAWEWVPARGQFYYHFFYRQQPDLNWRNPVVEKAMIDGLRFWLDRGVAGFRIDAVSRSSKTPSSATTPICPDTTPTATAISSTTTPTTSLR